MDHVVNLPVRFHVGGEFINYGRNVSYVGGDEEMAYIERDKISVIELRRHLRDHRTVTSTMRFFWLYPGRQLSQGLQLLVGDETCLGMCEKIKDGEIADIYVEECGGESESSKEYSDNEDDGVSRKRKLNFVSAPRTKDEAGPSNKAKKNGKNKQAIDHVEPINQDGFPMPEPELDDVSSDSDDSDFLPEDVDSSEDEEATELKRHAKAVKKQIREEGMLPIISLGKEVQHYEEEDEDLEQGNDTPYFDSSEEASYEDEEENEVHGIRKKSRFHRYSGKDPLPIFSEGMTFRGKAQFKSAVIKYALAMKRHIAFIKDDKDRVRAKCTWKGCPWVIYAAQRSKCDWFQVQTYKNQHNCLQIRKNKLVTATRIANKYERLMRANPSWKIKSIKETVLIDMFADVNDSKIKRAKSIVNQRVFSAAKGQYLRLFDYQAEILRSNPGSTVAITLDPEFSTPVFQRIYICFQACKEGFKAGCRKVVGLDGCFFKGGTSGELLCALGRDANNQIYPLAWAVVEKGTNNSWWWFVSLLQKDLGINNQGEGWVFISDQQKGLINAIEHLVPKAEHRMCARHIYANWRKKYRDNAFQKKFWKCAKAPCRMLFNYHRAKLAQLTVDGAKDMMKTDPIHWSRAWLKLGSNCDSVDNNMCESFNHMIIEARGYPILSMLEAIRTKVYVRIQENKCKSERWNQTLCPNISKKVNKLISQSGNCQAIWNGDNSFEIREEPNGYKVDLDKKECSCRYWQLSGIPCRHALSAIFTMNKNFEDYIARCFSVETYNKIYEHCLMPMEGMPSWPESAHPKPGPPGYVKMPGRPRKARRRDASEPQKKGKFSRAGAKMSCSLCGSRIHNMRTCIKNDQRGIKKNKKRNMAPEITVHPGESSHTHVISQPMSQGRVNPQIPAKKTVQREDRTNKSSAATAEVNGIVPAKKFVPTMSTRPQRNHKLPKKFMD